MCGCSHFISVHFLSARSLVRSLAHLPVLAVLRAGAGAGGAGVPDPPLHQAVNLAVPVAEHRVNPLALLVDVQVVLVVLTQTLTLTLTV